jgi:hypothetical protein
LISFAPVARSGEAQTGAELTAEQADTPLDSTIPELAGIVVLCNEQSEEQNACQPADSSAAGSGADGPARGEERANERAIRREDRAAARALDRRPEAQTADAPITEAVIVSVDRRLTFSNLNNYHRAKEAMTAYMMQMVQQNDAANADTLPNEIVRPWNALAREATRRGHGDEIDILAWSIIEDAMQAGNDETRIHARLLRLDAVCNQVPQAVPVWQRDRPIPPIRIPGAPCPPAASETGGEPINGRELADTDFGALNAEQKQRQILEMMSRVSKALHDTATGVVRRAY